MRYLLDTNISVLLIRQKSQTVLQRLAQHPVTDIAVSAITVAELQYGVAKSAHPLQNQKAPDYFLLPLTISPFDDRAALRMARCAPPSKLRERQSGRLMPC